MGRSARALLLVLLFQATAIAQYTISTFAGNGRSNFFGDGGPAAQSGVAVSGVTGVAVDHSGNVYLGDGNPTGLLNEIPGIPQAPFDLPLNVPTQLVVRRGTALSIPKTVSVAPAQPAIFTKDQSGTGQGAIVNGVTNRLADSSAPVTAGDTVAIYCTGLGAVNPPVPPGTAASGPVSTVQTVTVQIGGQSASVIYSGLAPGFAGLYQVNAVVPAGVATGSQVPVVVSMGGLSSPPVRIAVR